MKKIEAIVLKFQGHTHKEIARRLGFKNNTVDHRWIFWDLPVS